MLKNQDYPILGFIIKTLQVQLAWPKSKNVKSSFYILHSLKMLLGVPFIVGLVVRKIQVLRGKWKSYFQNPQIH